MQKVDVCAFSVDQALSPPLNEPGDEAKLSDGYFTRKAASEGTVHIKVTSFEQFWS